MERDEGGTGINGCKECKNRNSHGEELLFGRKLKNSFGSGSASRGSRYRILPHRPPRLLCKLKEITIGIRSQKGPRDER
jgi:hypothetical protein